MRGTSCCCVLSRTKQGGERRTRMPVGTGLTQGRRFTEKLSQGPSPTEAGAPATARVAGPETDLACWEPSEDGDVAGAGEERQDRC